MPLTTREAAQRRGNEVRQRADRPSKRHNETDGSNRIRAQVTGVEIRESANGDGLVQFDGHASVTETAYEMWDYFGPYSEVISAGAFDNSLARADLDVPFVLGHDQLRRIARTTTGTLHLSMDDRGLHVLSDLDPADQDVAYIVPKLRAGLIDEMSFAFRIVRGIWSPDYTEYRIEETDIHRGDVAIVGWGANPFTDAGVRAAAGSGQDSLRARLALEIALGAA
jgi:Escherichia/Staphylococcus phage prohead protease